MGNRPLILDAHTTVSSIDLERKVFSYVSADGDWNWDELRPFLPTGILMNLASTPPPLNENDDDVVIWKLSKNNLFSVNSAYHSFDSNN